MTNAFQHGEIRNRVRVEVALLQSHTVFLGELLCAYELAATVTDWPERFARETSVDDFEAARNDVLDAPEVVGIGGAGLEHLTRSPGEHPRRPVLASVPPVGVQVGEQGLGSRIPTPPQVPGESGEGSERFGQVERGRAAGVGHGPECMGIGGPHKVSSPGPRTMRRQ